MKKDDNSKIKAAIQPGKSDIEVFTYIVLVLKRGYARRACAHPRKNFLYSFRMIRKHRNFGYSLRVYK